MNKITLDMEKYPGFSKHAISIQFKTFFRVDLLTKQFYRNENVDFDP